MGLLAPFCGPLTLQFGLIESFQTVSQGLFSETPISPSRTLRREDRCYAAFATLSPPRLCPLDRTGGMGYVIACLFYLQKGRNESLWNYASRKLPMLAPMPDRCMPKWGGRSVCLASSRVVF